jgi:hypothetical protein
MVMVEVKDNKITIKGKRLFTAINKEEVVEVKIFNVFNPGMYLSSVYPRISSYLNYRLASAYFTAEILTWLEFAV